MTSCASPGRRRRGGRPRRRPRPARAARDGVAEALIAYSLGNFAGYKVFSMGGRSPRARSCASPCAATGRSRPARSSPPSSVQACRPWIRPRPPTACCARSREDFGSRAVDLPDGILARSGASPVVPSALREHPVVGARLHVAGRAERAFRQDAVASPRRSYSTHCQRPRALRITATWRARPFAPGSAIDLTITVPFGNRRFLPRGLLAWTFFTPLCAPGR